MQSSLSAVTKNRLEKKIDKIAQILSRAHERESPKTTTTDDFREM